MDYANPTEMSGTNPWVVMAAGGVICRQGQGNRQEVLLVKRYRYGDTSLPKGKLQAGESPEQAAVREVLEETGYHARITGVAGVQVRDIDHRKKITVYFQMVLEDKPQAALNPNGDEEVMEVLWVPVQDAANYLTYPDQLNLIPNS